MMTKCICLYVKLFRCWVQ